jgi:hypothetical protein
MGSEPGNTANTLSGGRHGRPPVRDSPGLAWGFVGLFFFVANGVGAGNRAADGEVSEALRLILVPLAIIVFWKLLEVECRPYRVTFPLDMGFLLYATSFLVLPYYFWRTQRWRGLQKVAWLLALWAGTYALWAALAWYLQ